MLVDPVRELRRSTSAVLQVGEIFQSCRFVVDPETGYPVTPVGSEALNASSCTLFVPEERDDTLQLLVEPTEIDPNRHPSCDRYLIYHGKPTTSRWALFRAQSAKFFGVVFDECRSPNLLRADEARLCKQLNAEPEVARRLCRNVGKSVESPVVVGVDQDGLDVRGRGEVIRVDFPHSAVGVDSAWRMIHELAQA